MASSAALVRRHSIHWTLAALAFLPLPAAAANFSVDCSGGTAGAYSSIGAALAAAVADPATSDRYILLKGNCTENVAIAGGIHRIWIAPEWDSCPWSACTTNGQPAQITAANAGQPVISVSGASDVTLVHLTLTGGAVGLSITGAAVTAYGVSADGNGQGIAVDAGGSLWIGEGTARNNKSAGLSVSNGSNAVFLGQLSWLQNKPLVLAGNGYAGLVVERSAAASWSGVQIQDNKGPGVLAFGGGIVLGTQCCGHSVVVSGNDVGAYLSEKTRAAFYGDTTIRDNGAIGIYVEKSSHVSLGGILVEGHGENGLNAVMGSQATFHSGNRIQGNGASGTAWSGGVRIDGSSNALFEDGGDPAGPSSITGNTGPGILVDLGSTIDVRTAVVQGNTGEGVRVRRGSLADFSAAATLRPNGSGPISCDRSSNVFADQLRRTFACFNVQPEGEARPARPIAGQ
jgi:hypothetical protein